MLLSVHLLYQKVAYSYTDNVISTNQVNLKAESNSIHAHGNNNVNAVFFAI